MIVEQEEPKILIWDLETGGLNSFRSNLAKILCFGYKWLGDKKAHVLTINQFPGWFSKRRGLNDYHLLKTILKIMEEADLTVGHYSERFDLRFFQGRCAIHNLPPPPPVKMRDTWRIARTAFNFSSNRLGALADTLGLSEQKQVKTRHDFPGWWDRALAGDSTVFKEMGAYCIQDVKATEALYLRIRVYDNPHPRVIVDRSKCRLCGGAVRYRGVAYVGEAVYRRFVCKVCRRWDRERKAVT